MNTKHYHFSAICGTAMASLAAILKKRGHKITGSDENVYPPMSDFLAENQIKVTSPFSKDNLIPHPNIIVIGNALSRGNPEVEYALEAHLHYVSMAELVKNEFIRGNTSIVVSGTHGKTTTTSLSAHVFDQCGKAPGFLVGGIPLNFGYSSRDVAKGGYFIIEGDEYDTCFFDKRSKFFHYLPDRLIITSIEFDHGDIFKDLDEIKKSFTLMLRQIPRNGLIIVNGDDANTLEVANKGFSPIITYGFSQTCDAVISQAKPLTDQIGMSFQLTYKQQSFHFTIPLRGEFNVMNATAVILLALNEGLPVDQIQKALSSFKNVRRRLEQLTKNTQVRVFDDFAHHPTAIRETIGALRMAWPDARILAVYEARSNTSVRKFHQDKMASAFKDADLVFFSKLHRKEKINTEDRLDLDRVVNELKTNGKEAIAIEDIKELEEACISRTKPGDIILLMSNGGFGGIQQRIAQRMDSTWYQPTR